MDHAGSWGAYISVPGVASLGVSALLYLVSAHQGQRADKLNNVVTVDCIEDLARLALPMLVAVRGRVNSKSPKKCELVDKGAVIHEVVEEEIYRKERESGRVVQEPFEVRRVFDQSEWFLDDGSQHVLKVENATEAARLTSAMETKQIFIPEEPSKTTMMKMLFEKAVRNMVKYGTRKTERYLPMDALITVVGEVCTNPSRAHLRLPAADNSQQPGSSPFSRGDSSAAALVQAAVGPSGRREHEVFPFVVRKPTQGPFYITPLTLPQLHASLANTATIYKYVSLGFGVLGVALIARRALTRLWCMHQQRQVARRLAHAEAVRKQRRAAQQQGADGGTGSGSGTAAGQGASAGTGQAAQQGATAGGAGGGDADSTSDRPPNTCVVCMDDDVEMVFTACGHMCCCYACGWQMSRCPICRTSSRPIRVYKP